MSVAATEVLEKQAILRVSNEGFLTPQQILQLCRKIGAYGHVSKYFPEGDTRQPRIVDLVLDAGCGYALLGQLKALLAEMKIPATEVINQN